MPQRQKGERGVEGIFTSTNTDDIKMSGLQALASR